MNPCVEVKHTYFGEEVKANCFLIDLISQSSQTEGLLKYLFDKTWFVHDLTLDESMFTIAYYNDALPYNVYCWFSNDNDLIGYYFNIVDETKLTTDRFEFRDLIVDLLVYPDLRYVVLDEDEIPSDIEPLMAEKINQAKNKLIADLPSVIEMIQSKIQSYL